MTNVRDIMTVDVVTVVEDQPLSEAVKLMKDKSLSCVVVISGDNPIGLIAQSDVINKVIAQGKSSEDLKVKDVMTSPIITIHPEVDFVDALSIMDANHVKKLVVVEDDELSGIMTYSDIVTKTKVLAEYNKKLLFYQNIQSYVIFIFFVFIVVFLVIRYLM